MSLKRNVGFIIFGLGLGAVARKAKRRSTIWIFGAGNGRRYNDNYATL